MRPPPVTGAKTRQARAPSEVSAQRADATGKSLFNATFGRAGTAIGEGAAAAYLEVRDLIMRP